MLLAGRVLGIVLTRHVEEVVLCVYLQGVPTELYSGIEVFHMLFDRYLHVLRVTSLKQHM